MGWLIKLKLFHEGGCQQQTVIVSHPSGVQLLHFLQSMGNQYFLSETPHFFSCLGSSSLFPSLFTLGLSWFSEWYRARLKALPCPALHRVFIAVALYHTRKTRFSYILLPLTQLFQQLNGVTQLSDKEFNMKVWDNLYQHSYFYFFLSFSF